MGDRQSYIIDSRRGSINKIPLAFPAEIFPVGGEGKARSPLQKFFNEEVLQGNKVVVLFDRRKNALPGKLVLLPPATKQLIFHSHSTSYRIVISQGAILEHLDITSDTVFRIGIREEDNNARVIGLRIWRSFPPSPSDQKLSPFPCSTSIRKLVLGGRTACNNRRGDDWTAFRKLLKETSLPSLEVLDIESFFPFPLLPRKELSLLVLRFSLEEKMHDFGENTIICTRNLKLACVHTVDSKRRCSCSEVFDAHQAAQTLSISVLQRSSRDSCPQIIPNDLFLQWPLAVVWMETDRSSTLLSSVRRVLPEALLEKSGGISNRTTQLPPESAFAPQRIWETSRSNMDRLICLGAFCNKEHDCAIDESPSAHNFIELDSKAAWYVRNVFLQHVKNGGPRSFTYDEKWNFSFETDGMVFRARKRREKVKKRRCIFQAGGSEFLRKAVLSPLNRALCCYVSEIPACYRKGRLFQFNDLINEKVRDSLTISLGADGLKPISTLPVMGLSQALRLLFEFDRLAQETDSVTIFPVWHSFPLPETKKTIRSDRLPLVERWPQGLGIHVSTSPRKIIKRDPRDIGKEESTALLCLILTDQVLQLKGRLFPVPPGPLQIEGIPVKMNIFGEHICVTRDSIFPVLQVVFQKE